MCRTDLLQIRGIEESGMLLGCFHLCQGSLFLSKKAAVKFIMDELKGPAKIISHISKCPVILSCSFYS